MAEAKPARQSNLPKITCLLLEMKIKSTSADNVDCNAMPYSN